jgi:hypothetical protein
MILVRHTCDTATTVTTLLVGEGVGTPAEKVGASVLIVGLDVGLEVGCPVGLDEG